MYSLQAIILDIYNAEKAEKYGLKAVPLKFGLSMILLTYDFVSSNSLPFQPLTDGEIEDFYGDLESLCREFSSLGKAAYVEAEFFGGDGTQGCALFLLGEAVQPPIEDKSAINKALRWLGVSAHGQNDEFLVVGLDKHRSTEGWINA